MNQHKTFGWAPGADLDQVDKAHRVLNIGSYNPYVSSCGQCDSDERIDNFGRHCLGFGMPDKPGGCLDGNLAVVYECPACFERQWSHTALAGGYYTYLRYLHRQANRADARERKSNEQKT
jgi:hypothetical protein